VSRPTFDATSTQDEWLTVPQAARWLGVSRTTGYMLVRDGRIPAVFFGNPSPEYPRGKIIRVARTALMNLAQQQPELAGTAK
jgi:excisionase family DNA binding protein